MSVRLFWALSITAALAAPAHAQFAISIQQNGQAYSAANGASIALNAPLVAQSAVATVKLTYLGNATARFPSAAQLLGSSNFTETGGVASITLNPLQSASFDLHYMAADASQVVGQFFWAFNEVSTFTGMTVGTGAIAFNLIGTAPNLTVGEVTANGSFQVIANGGSIQFPDTLVNASSPLTVAISNPGSGSGTINSITVTGDGYQLRGVPLLPIVIGAGNQLNVTVQFLPASSGLKKGSLQIAFASGTYTAALSGNGLASFLTYKVTQDAVTSALTPDQTITIDDTKVGAKSSVIVQFQNSGTVPIVLSSVGISGAGFSITDGPFIPITLQPQQSNSIAVTYSPTLPGPATGRLLIGGDNFTVSARGLGPLLQFSYQVGSATVPVNPGETVTFSPLAAGQTGSLQFKITNAGTTAASVASIGVVDNTGVFKLANLPVLPLQLDAAAMAVFTISYSPNSAGASSTTLVINNQAFGISGFSSAPPSLPSYHFTGASGAQLPFQQPAIGLSLAAPYPIALSGTLTLTIVSNSFAADPAVQFSSGGRQASFTIPANTLDAIFPNGATQLRFQSGTVAGAIQIAPNFAVGTANGTDITPTNATKVQFTVASLAPTLLTATLSTRNATGFSIVVTGFSTTRFLDHLTFQLTPASGFTLGGVSFSVDLSAAARVWFQGAASQNLGGQFTVEIPFNLAATGTSTGTDLTKSLSAVSLTAIDEIGVSNVLQVPIP